MKLRQFKEGLRLLHQESVSARTRLCAEYINAYWRERGYEVNAVADGPFIRSELIAGLPPAWRGPKAGAS